MTPATILLALRVLARASFDASDTDEDRDALLSGYAEAIAAESRSHQEAAVAVGQIVHETHGDSRVLLGMCSLIGRRACDSGHARGGVPDARRRLP